MDYIVARDLNSLYIILDIIWLVVLTVIFLYSGKKQAVIVGVLAGLLYFIVDYGGFYMLAGTRSVEGAPTGLFLFWLSMSYGFTNFTWIWLLLENDGHQLEWSLLPIIGWLGVGLLAQNFGTNFHQIHIQRYVGSYHGIMAAILTVGYLILIIRNLNSKHGQAPIARLIIIGIGVQFAWEAVLLLTGIRPAGVRPLIINSLIETNLGMPYIYLIELKLNNKTD
ncbi:MAG: hypothetical protein PQJ61_08460 [Spirochaetales bacterium]|uniref:Uncharacterized protein n=1 Tax=Candidatus Thalassospirochaeta sargassi TaxID=3119039 RepID=A0AAJ1ICP5_9SPIO|nr:hypothetical protein [Spirochaetales bacterium]